jgi:acyl-coenzyme A synthetase/AMP-(fatty) acid ligase
VEPYVQSCRPGFFTEPPKSPSPDVSDSLLFRDLIRASARAAEHRASILADARHRCTYPEIPERLDQIQSFLRDRAVRPGECITVELANSLPSAITVLALLDAGYSMLLVPAAGQGARVQGGELQAPRFSRWLLSVSADESREPCALEEPTSFLRLRANPEYRASTAAPDEHAPRVYGRTSGSLGTAKLAVHSYSRVRANASRARERLRLDPSCRIALPSPIFHLYALRAAFLPGFVAGASIDFLERANLLRYLEREREFDPNVAFVTPTFCETLLRGRRSARPYRYMVIGGDRMSEFTRSVSEALHGPLINAYGSTEMGLVAMGELAMPPELRSGTVGRLLPGVVCRLVPSSEDGHGTDSPCELQLQSPYGFKGYVDLDGNELQLRSAFDGGWFCTRDLARRAADGTLQILGRSDLSVNRNGMLLPFADLESRLRAIDGVQDAAVAAGENDIRGRGLVAFCVLRSDVRLSAQELRARCAKLVPAFAVPDIVQVLDDLPRLVNGKLDRRSLAGMAQSAAARTQAGDGEPP